ncbi:MAG: RsmB/NOP family class I SAM-dependent RNA methyltransferase [Lachnospiraceae bacterium]|nr:RsmB/NOP family class I SAM-dependent RNA methyltransferase [Lachnospiraceae bacterium]
MLPQEFLNRMKESLGEEYPLFLASYEKEEAKALRRNPLKTEKEEFEEKMPFTLRAVSWTPMGYYYPLEEQPGQHPFHQAGAYYIQEPSAMAVAEYLQVKPGERILDLCAAPGGKSTQIGGYLQGEGLLVCNEPHPARAKILSENVERMGVANALVTNEMPDKLARIFPEYFDKILVDAPCSGEGMFRKNEEARQEWSLENVQLCARRQAEILDEAAKMLRPGGRLVYSTCTFAREENEDSIASFLKRNGDFQFLEDKRLWPHKIEGEGHYIAVLEKKGSLQEDYRPLPANGLAKILTLKECREFVQFGQEFIRDFADREWRLYLFGDQLYHLPVDMPSLKGLKVLRPGLHLGTLKKNRFEPSHALALAFLPADFNFTWNLSVDSREVRDYLAGQTFLAEGEKGWYLITVDGYGLGWGKLAGGIMKNHYPKGLRR